MPSRSSRTPVKPWYPGIPLAPDPRTRLGGQVVRHMFDVLSEDLGNIMGHLRYAERACLDCLVTWVGEGTCWVCGKKATERTDEEVWRAVWGGGDG